MALQIRVLRGWNNGKPACPADSDEMTGMTEGSGLSQGASSLFGVDGIGLRFWVVWTWLWVLD